MVFQLAFLQRTCSFYFVFRCVFLGECHLLDPQKSLSSTGSSSRITSMTPGRKASRNFANHVLALRTEDKTKFRDDGLCGGCCLGMCWGYYMCCVVVLVFFQCGMGVVWRCYSFHLQSWLFKIRFVDAYNTAFSMGESANG